MLQDELRDTEEDEGMGMGQTSGPPPGETQRRGVRRANGKEIVGDALGEIRADALRMGQLEENSRLTVAEAVTSVMIGRYAEGSMPPWEEMVAGFRASRYDARDQMNKRRLENKRARLNREKEQEEAEEARRKAKAEAKKGKKKEKETQSWADDVRESYELAQAEE